MSNLDYEAKRPEGPNAKRLIRIVLMLSSVVMIVLAALTFSGILGPPPFLGWLFLVVAAVDLTIGFVVFKD